MGDQWRRGEGEIESKQDETYLVGWLGVVRRHHLPLGATTKEKMAAATVDGGETTIKKRGDQWRP